MFLRPSGFITAGLIAFVLSACSTVQEERSLGRELDDNNASWSIKSAMLRAEGYALDGVDVEVAEGVARSPGMCRARMIARWRSVWPGPPWPCARSPMS